jgi:hypothetical protein
MCNPLAGTRSARLRAEPLSYVAMRLLCSQYRPHRTPGRIQAVRFRSVRVCEDIRAYATPEAIRGHKVAQLYHHLNMHRYVIIPGTL